MTKNQLQQPSFDLTRMVKKFFLSSFVIFSFVAYAIQQRFTKPESPLIAASTNPSVVAEPIQLSANSSAAISAQALANNQPTLEIPPPPINPPTPTPTLGMYKDGTYTGPTVDAYYGLVKVQATIQNGKITDVQFLQYPSDRRTSQRINSIAMPYLQQEALQAQSARINIISGATFTSEGFAMSLNAALKTAKN